MKAVLDAGVVFSGAGWRRAEPHACLVALARRLYTAFASAETLAELQDVARRKSRAFPDPAAALAVLEWYYRTVRVVDAVPLGKQRSQDAADDPYLAVALAARADAIVSRDPHLLRLEKPFGIEVLTPRAFLNRLYHPGL